MDSKQDVPFPERRYPSERRRRVQWVLILVMAIVYFLYLLSIRVS